MKHKFLSKLILGVLISTTLVGSFTRVSYAQSGQVVEVTQNNESTITGEEINDIIERFKNIQGDEVDGEYTIIKNEGYIGRINKDTGDITHETYDENGVLVDSYTTNFYENMQNTTRTKNLKHLEERKTLIFADVNLNGLYCKVSEYNNGQKLYAQDSISQVKQFYLNGSYEYNNSVQNFYRNVVRTSRAAKQYENSVGSTSIAVAIAAFIGFIPVVGVPAMITILLDLGYGFLVGDANSITGRYNEFIRLTDEANVDFDFLAP